MGRRAASAPGRPARPRRVDYPRAGRRGLARWVPSWRLVAGLGLALVAVVAALFALGYALTPIPGPNEFAQAETTVVYYADGTTEMGRFAAQDRRSVPISQVPEHVRQAVIAAEDRTFAENRGVSPSGIARAFWSNLRGGATQGGSTITQQYVKNFYLQPEESYRRKITEAFIAVKVDQQLTKAEILERYLNTIYFGRGAYGIQTAAQAYFGKDVADLTLAEGAALAGIIPAPSSWDPAVNPQKAAGRFAYVLDGMVTMGVLDAPTRAQQVFPPVAPYHRTDTFAGPTGYLLAAAREEVLARTALTENDIDRNGLSIVTTIDPQAQSAAVAAMQDEDAFPTQGRPPTLQAGLVSIDPATGAVRAMYGGADYLIRPRNAATQDIAQAGSTFKPFALVAALEQGIPLRTRFDGSSPQTFATYTDKDGTPVPVRNFGGTSYGRMDLLQATENSVNTVFVGLNERVGPEATMDAAVRAGIDADTDGLAPVTSNVLGTASPTVLDMGQAYATFAAQGTRTTPHLVASVAQGGELVYEADTTGEKVFADDVMADATYAMSQVVENGSGRYARRLNRPAAGKTGTSNDNKSAWFAGFTPQLATVVALYNVGPDGEQLQMPAFGGVRQITGGSFPVRIWTTYMAAALEGTEVLDLPPRADVAAEPGKQPPATSTTTATEPTPTSEPSATAPAPTEPAPTGTTTAPAPSASTTAPPTTTEPVPTLPGPPGPPGG